MGKVLETISAAPAEAWVGLIGVIFGSLIAILTAWLTSRATRKQMKLQLEHEEKNHRQRVAKERLEELYSLVSQWETEVLFSNMLMSRLMAGKINIEQYTESMEGTENRIDFNRVTMIAGIYGQSFQPAFAEVVAARDDSASIIELWMHSVMKSQPNQALANQFVAKIPRLTVAIDFMKKEIVKAAKEV